MVLFQCTSRDCWAGSRLRSPSFSWPSYSMESEDARGELKKRMSERFSNCGSGPQSGCDPVLMGSPLDIIRLAGAWGMLKPKPHLWGMGGEGLRL